jgi:hypothetical protein
MLIFLFADRSRIVIFQTLFFNEQFTELSEINQKIASKANIEYSSYNKYGFTDANHSYTKPDSVFGIAIIGDSFVLDKGFYTNSRGITYFINYCEQNMRLQMFTIGVEMDGIIKTKFLS